MRRQDVNTYRPNCEAIPPSGCSSCNLAYDCERRRLGQRWSWPLIALFALSAMALLGYAT